MVKLKRLLELKRAGKLKRSGRRPIASEAVVPEPLVRDCETLMDMGWDILESAPREVGALPKQHDAPNAPTNFVIVPSVAEARQLLAKRRRK